MGICSKFIIAPYRLLLKRLKTGNLLLFKLRVSLPEELSIVLKKVKKLTKGDRYGMIQFGSRLDLYLPQDFEAAVKVGDKTNAGSTIIGYMK